MGSKMHTDSSLSHILQPEVLHIDVAQQSEPLRVDVHSTGRQRPGPRLGSQLDSQLDSQIGSQIGTQSIGTQSIETQSIGPECIVTLVAGLAAEEVDQRLREAARWADIGNRALAFYLADMKIRGLYQVLGHPTIVRYAVCCLDMSRRRVRDLLLVGERLPELASIDRAFEAGWLPWSKVRQLCRVATPETESAWLRCAERSTQDELARQVRGKRRGDRPDVGAGLPGAKFRVVAELDAVQQLIWENAREKLRAESGYESDVTDTDVLMEMARLLLASDADGSVPGRRPVDGSIFKVVVNCEGAGTRLVTEDGEIAVPPELGEMITADSVVAPPLRRKVLARDGHRCRHCGSRRSLHVHHVRWRSKGGAIASPNLVTVCAKCHGLVHAGMLDVEPVDVEPIDLTPVDAQPGEWQPDGASSSRDARQVAPCATPPAVPERTFRFLDKDGRPMGRTWREGPRIRKVGLAEPTASAASKELAASGARPVSGAAPLAPFQAGAPARRVVGGNSAQRTSGPSRPEAARAAITSIDPAWFREHLDWFENAAGGLRIKRRHREEFERLFAG
jgi:hypothetical protein